MGFNGSDAFFWSNKARFIAHTDSLEAWPEALSKIIAEKTITDIVLYGDTRPLHAEAIKLAKGLGLRPLAKIQGVFASQAHLWR